MSHEREKVQLSCLSICSFMAADELKKACTAQEFIEKMNRLLLIPSCVKNVLSAQVDLIALFFTELLGFVRF